jgi:integrase
MSTLEAGDAARYPGTFAAHSREVLAALQVRPGTLRGYEDSLRLWLLPALGRRPLAAVDRRAIEEALAAVLAARSPKTARNVLAVAKLVLGRAVDWGRLPSNPALGLRVRVPRHQALVWTREQREAALRALEEGPAGNAVRVLLGTGLRLREALALQPEDWWPAQGAVRVAASKTDAGVRLVDVPGWLAPVLDGALPLRCTAAQVRGALDRCSRAARVPRIRVHDLRHTRLTALLLAGAPADYVCRQAGHADPGFFLKTYAHVLEMAGRPERRAWADAA